MKNCMFTGLETDSDEHVFPKWLQNRFLLWNQKLVLPNGTNLPYRMVTVPTSKLANNDFGKIENNISRGVYNKDELYLWAYKLHIGMLSKHVDLKYDRSVVDSGPILDPNDYRQDFWLFQRLFSVWKSGGNFVPSPLGSVFLVKSPFQKDFSFIHCLLSGTIQINLGDVLLMVFLWDQGEASRTTAEKVWYRHHLPAATIASADGNSMPYMAAQTWACEVAYWVWRHQRKLSFVSAERSFGLVPSLFPPPPKKSNEAQYALFCKTFNLTLDAYGGDNGEAAHRYSNFTRPDFTKLRID